MPFGHLDAVTCLDTLVAFVRAYYTHKQLQMAYEEVGASSFVVARY